MQNEELLFVPLGGAGEIGLNLNLYGLGGQWLMVDLGLSFADESQRRELLEKVDAALDALRK